MDVALRKMSSLKDLGAYVILSGLHGLCVPYACLQIAPGQVILLLLPLNHTLFSLSLAPFFDPGQAQRRSVVFLWDKYYNLRVLSPAGLEALYSLEQSVLLWCCISPSADVCSVGIWML